MNITFKIDADPDTKYVASYIYKGFELHMLPRYGSAKEAFEALVKEVIEQEEL
jgi:hypothetical protein